MACCVSTAATAGLDSGADLIATAARTGRSRPQANTMVVQPRNTNACTDAHE